LQIADGRKEVLPNSARARVRAARPLSRRPNGGDKRHAGVNSVAAPEPRTTANSNAALPEATLKIDHGSGMPAKPAMFGVATSGANPRSPDELRSAEPSTIGNEA
jgi:hypothetical protein